MDDIEKREIEVGQNNSKWVEITDGLAEGEIVLLSQPAGFQLAPAGSSSVEVPEFSAGSAGERGRNVQARGGERPRGGGGPAAGGGRPSAASAERGGAQADRAGGERSWRGREGATGGGRPGGRPAGEAQGSGRPGQAGGE